MKRVKLKKSNEKAEKRAIFSMGLDRGAKGCYASVTQNQSGGNELTEWGGVVTKTNNEDQCGRGTKSVVSNDVISSVGIASFEVKQALALTNAATNLTPSQLTSKAARPIYLEGHE